MTDSEVQFINYCNSLKAFILPDQGVGPSLESKTSPVHLHWMLTQLIKTDMPWGKKCRWLGYIQGVMVSKGFLDVDEERDATRPFLPSLDFPSERDKKLVSVCKEAFKEYQELEKAGEDTADVIGYFFDSVYTILKQEER